jgi:hypothetical protein
MKMLNVAVSRVMWACFVSVMPVISFATEEDIGTKATRLSGQATGVLTLLLTLAQVVALVFLWSGISKIRKDKEQPGQGLMGQGMMACAIAVALYFLPRLMGVGQSTIFP